MVLTARTTPLTRTTKNSPISGPVGWFLRTLLPLIMISSGAAEDFLVTTNASNGPGSLDQAMLDASLNGESDTITFGITGNINLEAGLTKVSEDLEILGPGADLLTIHRVTGGPEFRFLTIASGTTVKISGLTIANGRFISDGGVIFNSGNLLLEACAIVGNRSFGVGTVLNVQGDLEVRDCLITENIARSGSALWNQDGTTFIINSTVSGNIVDAGPGINSTISNTSASADAILNIFNSTITANDDDGTDEGHIFNNRTTNDFRPILRLRSTILAGNIGAPDVFNFFGTVSSLGHNVLGTNSSIAGDFIEGYPNPSQDFVGTFSNRLDPLLLPLQHNGGPTKTHLPRIDSFVIDAGSAIGPIGSSDQRGEARIEDGDCDTVSAPDIGSAELEDCRRGTVNRGLGLVQDVLFVNGSSGDDPDRRVVLGLNEPITVNLETPPAGPACGFYALYAWQGSSLNPTLLSSRGEQFGYLMNPSPLQPMSGPQPFRCILGSGVPAAICKGVRGFPGAPLKTPWSVTRSNGLGSPLEITLQALVEDQGSLTLAPVSISNAVLLEIRP